MEIEDWCPVLLETASLMTFQTLAHPSPSGRCGFELSAVLCDNSSPHRRNINVQARFDHFVLCSRTQSFQLCRTQEEEAPASGAPDKAYLQKLLDGWSARNAADMAQYYDQGDYNFFDIAPLKYSNWAEYEKGVTELLKGYKSLKLTVNDDAQIHTDGNLTWTTATVKEDAVTTAGKARNGHVALDPDLRKAGRQVDDRARAHVGAAAVDEANSD